MTRRIRDYSSLRSPVLVESPIPSPAPYYKRWGGYGYGTSYSSNSYTENFSDDGHTYQLGALVFYASPLNYGRITVKRNDTVLINHYGNLSFFWQPRSINSWYFSYPDYMRITLTFPAGIYRYFNYVAAYYRF